MGMSYGAALQSGSNAILYRHQRSFTPTPPRAKLSREEPDAGNLHVRVCEGWGWQHPHLLGRLLANRYRRGLRRPYHVDVLDFGRFWIGFIEQHRRQALTHVPFEVVGQHAEKD